LSQTDLLYKIEKAKNLKDIIDIQKYSKKDLLEAMRLKPNNVVKRYDSIVERKILKDTELSVMNLKILSAINLLCSPTQTEILNYIDTTAANLSQRISWLENKGYVKFIQANKTKDKRKKKLKITLKARRIIKKSIQAINNFKNEISSNFTKKEIINVVKYFTKVSKILDKYEKEYS